MGRAPDLNASYSLVNTGGNLIYESMVERLLLGGGGGGGGGGGDDGNQK